MASRSNAMKQIPAVQNSVAGTMHRMLRIEAQFIFFMRVCWLSVEPMRKAIEPGFDGVDDRIGRGGACGEADRLDAVEPFLAEVSRALNVVDARAKLAAGVHQFARVVAVGPADHYHHIRLPR